MAISSSGLYKILIGQNWTRLKFFLQQQPIVFHNLRCNHMFKHLAESKKHDTKYNYEISKDPEEWSWVEKLMPLETVPIPMPKLSYPSGWRPFKDESLKHPYFVERSKNHMLPVYLKNCDRGQRKETKMKNIHGDLWKLYDELKAYIEEMQGKKIASYVNEGNGAIVFKGDQVYYVEQWLLSKGF